MALGLEVKSLGGPISVASFFKDPHDLWGHRGWTWYPLELPLFLSQQLARKEVMRQPSPSSTFSLGLRLGGVGSQASRSCLLHPPSSGSRVSTPSQVLGFTAFAP